MKTKPACAIRHLQFGFLNQPIGFRVRRFSARVATSPRPTRLDPGRAFSNASVEVNRASQTLNAAKREKLKSGFGQIQSPRKIRAAASGSAVCDTPWPDFDPVRVLRHRWCRHCPRRI